MILKVSNNFLYLAFGLFAILLGVFIYLETFFLIPIPVVFLFIAFAVYGKENTPTDIDKKPYQILYLGVGLFALLNAYFVYKEMFYFMALPIAAVIVAVALFRLDWLLMLIVFPHLIRPLYFCSQSS